MKRTPAERYLLMWLWILIICLTAALIAVATLAPRAMRPLYFSGDERWIDRAVRANAKGFGESPEQVRRRTFPIVLHLDRQVCVELRSTLANGTATSLSCYDRRTGQLTEQRLSVVN